MIRTVMKIGVTSYRSEALGPNALLLMLRICLLRIEIIQLVIHSIGYTDSGPTISFTNIQLRS